MRLGRVDMRRLRSRVGHVGPRHPLRSLLTVRDVVLTGLMASVERVPPLSPTRDETAAAESLVDLRGLVDLREAHRPVLSRGQPTRALIARSLMPSPWPLLLDDPATGLDVADREQLIDRLEVLGLTRLEPASVLVNRHLEELPPGTTHAMLLRDGRCLVTGRVGEILAGLQASACFDHPVRFTQVDGWWSVRTRRPAPAE
ncbi:ABC transporter ATP-binding protein [Streptomyces hydrogenans]|uniref:ABC transporter ATP-binding protein n=1 Tax=Streptomyces hydrogenans TaxID=1873719 RepID=UPI0036AF0D19